MTIKTKDRICHRCNGTGSQLDVWGENEHDCYGCGGTGKIMKIIYEIDTDEDMVETADMYKYAAETLNALCSIGNYLREQVKYGNLDGFEADAFAEQVYDKFFEILSENHLDRDIVGF